MKAKRKSERESEYTTIAISPEFRDVLKDNIPKSYTYEQYFRENLEL